MIATAYLFFMFFFVTNNFKFQQNALSFEYIQGNMFYLILQFY
jgi:hypothetical protein